MSVLCLTRDGFSDIIYIYGMKKVAIISTLPIVKRCSFRKEWVTKKATILPNQDLISNRNPYKIFYRYNVNYGYNIFSIVLILRIV